MDPVAPTVEQPMVARPTAPTIEEPLATRLTSPSDGLHDEGNHGVEEVWDAAVTSSGLVGVGMEPVGDLPSTTEQGPPTVVEQASSAAVSMAGVALGRSVQA